MDEPTTEPDPDLDVLHRVAAGDGEAFASLVERHQERLIRLCERMLGDREGARDAAQEVFLRVYRKAGSFRPRGQVYTWIYRIAVNHCLNRVRRRKVVRFLGLGGPDEEAGVAFEPRDEGPGPEERLQARERWAATRRVLDALPESQRPIVVLAKFEGLSYREIAEVLGITESAVESRLVRAMRRLRAAQEAQEAQEAGPSRVTRTRESQG